MFDRTTPVANQPATSAFIRDKFNSLHDEATKFGGAWSNLVTYLVNTLVYQTIDGKDLFFISLDTSFNEQPLTNPAKWKQVTFPSDALPPPASMQLILNDETESSEMTILNSENQVGAVTLQPNNFEKIKIEIGVRLRATDGTNFMLRIKEGGTLRKVFQSQGTAGNTKNESLSVIIAGKQTSAVQISLTAQMTLTSSAGTTITHFRLWGIN